MIGTFLVAGTETRDGSNKHLREDNNSAVAVRSLSLFLVWQRLKAFLTFRGGKRPTVPQKYPGWIGPGEQRSRLRIRPC